MTRERELGALHFGQVPQVSRGTIDALVATGTEAREAHTAVVHALLAVGSQAAREEALQALDQWQPAAGDEAERDYLRGVCLAAAGDRIAAQQAWRACLARKPRHELAKSALGRSLEEQYRLTEALPYYREVLAAAPDRLAARLDLARVLRKLNRTADARKVLEPLTVAGDIPPAVPMEAGEIAYEAGDYKQAAEWFGRADLDGPHVAESLRSAASNFAYHGDFARSAALFARVDDAQGRARQQSELERRVRIDPSDASAAEQLKRLSQARAPANAGGATGEPALSPLFARHCAACHGTSGDGSGTASRYLYPRPRNLRAEKYRLVSTRNLVPSHDDIALVIRQGIPGTSMPAFEKLPESEREQLTQDVLRLYQSRFVGREPQHPDEPLAVPELTQSSGEAIARGQALFARTGCQQCHGDDGRGAGGPALFDDVGRQTVARDLVSEPMKGGASIASLYLRIRLGMPGTPHPAAASLDEAQVIDLVHYCRSLAAPDQKPTTNFERSLRMSGGK